MIYVFLDTNIYLKGRSGKELTDLTQDYFPHLVRHAQNGRLRLVMPAVTKAEIEAHVRIAADKCREAIQSIALPLHSDALSAYIRQLRKEYDPDAFVSEALIRLYKFWENTEYITLDVTEIDVEKHAVPMRRRARAESAANIRMHSHYRHSKTSGRRKRNRKISLRSSRMTALSAAMSKRSRRRSGYSAACRNCSISGGGAIRR